MYMTQRTLIFEIFDNSILTGFLEAVVWKRFGQAATSMFARILFEFPAAGGVLIRQEVRPTPASDGFEEYENLNWRI